MPDLRISLAISDYVHTRDVADGRIKPVGIELIVNNLSFEQAAFRFGANREFDISEFSLANYCAIISSPDGGDIVGLPVFPSRVFRHSSIYINDKSGICDAAASRDAPSAFHNGRRPRRSTCAASCSTMPACHCPRSNGSRPGSIMPAGTSRSNPVCPTG